MKKFLVKRIGYMIVTLVIIITATFYMMHSIPGDPLAHMARNLPEQTKANYYAKYGLDKSTTEQYGIFMKNLITKGDLGESLKYPGTYITDTLLENSKVSATPGGLALIAGVFLGIILGIVAALHKNKWPDYIVMFIAILGITVPVFVLASLLQFVFCVQLGVLPTTGWGSWQNVVLPTVVLSFGTIATYARYVKSNMLDVMNQDYIRTARALGEGEWSIIWKYAMKNALLPIITIIGYGFTGLMGGTLIIEQVFSLMGIGTLMLTAIQTRDVPLVCGITVVISVIFCLVQLLVDILYIIFDPRLAVKIEK